MNVNTINLTPEEAKELLADERLILATRKEIEDLRAELEAARTENADLKSLNATLSMLAAEVDKARRARDQYKGYYIHAQDRIDGMSKTLVAAVPGVKYDCEEDLLSDLVRQRDKYLSVIECANNNTRRVATERDELLKANAAMREALVPICADSVEIERLIDQEWVQPEDFTTITYADKVRAAKALSTPAPEALERVKKEAQAEVLDWLAAEADRQRRGIVLAFGQVEPGDILGIAVKKSTELRGQR